MTSINEMLNEIKTYKALEVDVMKVFRQKYGLNDDKTYNVFHTDKVVLVVGTEHFGSVIGKQSPKYAGAEFKKEDPAIGTIKMHDAAARSIMKQLQAIKVDPDKYIFQERVQKTRTKVMANLANMTTSDFV